MEAQEEDVRTGKSRVAESSLGKAVEISGRIEGADDWRRCRGRKLSNFEYGTWSRHQVLIGRQGVDRPLLVCMVFICSVILGLLSDKCRDPILQR